MADIQLYTGELGQNFSADQLSLLKTELDKRLISTRKGGGGMLKYIEGHDAIDQANRIFGHGNWAHRALSIEQVVLYDPLTNEAVGIEYKAVVELVVRGAVAPIVDVGSQPVSTWNVHDQIMQRRLKAAKNGKVDESEFSLIEKREARAVIVDAHEAAKKGAVTDGMKRCMRAYGDQFGNSLYGDGHLRIDDQPVTATPAGNGNRVVDAVQPKAQQPSGNGNDTKPALNAQSLYTKGWRLKLWKDVVGFHQQCSSVLGKLVTAEVAKTLSQQELAAIDADIEKATSGK